MERVTKAETIARYKLHDTDTGSPELNISKHMIMLLHYR